MRTAFIQQLTLEARRNPRVFLIVGDLGFSVVEPFATEFPDRFLNAGVAEQNMTGVAAGLASEGYHVFTYSIANFPTLRCLEQIRNDVCYHRLPVTVVAVGGGLAYGNLGYSHHAVQDLAILRTLPGITVLSPGDPGETRECVAWLTEHPGPSYLRIGKAGEKVLHEVRGIDRGLLPVRLTADRRVALVSTGGILDEVLKAADQLAAAGTSVSVFSAPWIKPMSAANVAALAPFEAVITVEEHIAEGGLASALREALPAGGPAIHSLAASSETAWQVGSQAWLRDAAGISADHIAARCRTLLG